jgi:hypothetical protein
MLYLNLGHMAFRLGLDLGHLALKLKKAYFIVSLTFKVQPLLPHLK